VAYGSGCDVFVCAYGATQFDVSQECYNSVTRVLQECYKSVT
jgi:hypothetical protein